MTEPGDGGVPRHRPVFRPSSVDAFVPEVPRRLPGAHQHGPDGPGPDVPAPGPDRSGPDRVSPDRSGALRQGRAEQGGLDEAPGRPDAPEHPHLPRRMPSSGPSRGHLLPHLSPGGEARMVDVGDKPVTARSATAKGLVLLSDECRAALADDALPKGDALAVARIAGVMGAKRTSDLVPLCHPLPLTGVDVHLEPTTEGVEITATVRTTHHTGVEMEALTAVCTAALGLVDMVKAVDQHARLTDVRVTAKSGGRSGDWVEQ